MADDATRAALVESLMASLTGAPQKRRAVKLSDDTQVFEQGQLGAVPGGGGGLTTYKELCALATDLGQPDLVYRFMELANHQAALNSSRGAAFGFAGIAAIAGDALAPHLPALLPRLYRHQFDPNGKVRDAMRHIWQALLPDPRAALTQHFSGVIASLLKEMGSSQWRVRESAAAAAADLLQGRRWAEVGPHFEELWVMALRTMDDVKETAGISLGRAVRGLTLRLADPELTPPAEGRAAVAAALPLLLEKGLTSQVQEVLALSLDTTSRLAKAAGPALLRPHLPTLVPTLLEALSGLEDGRLNYIETHAERLGVDAGRLEAARVAAAAGGAVGETLDLCAASVDGASWTELAPRLTAVIRRGVGTNTRAGAGRFVARVAARLGAESTGGGPQLMRALADTCAVERSAAVRRAYASAHAALARHAPAGRVAKAVAAALEAYGSGGGEEGGGGGAQRRLAAGLLLRELGKDAGDVFARHAGEVAPVAYLAQFDDDADVAAMWSEVWEECATSAGAGLRLHLPEVLARAGAGLQSGQWGRKKAAAAAIVRIARSAGDALGPHVPALMEALLREAPGRIWDGKEVLLEALAAVPAATCGGGGGGALSPELRGRAVAALLEAAGKKKSGYRRAALLQLEALLTALGTAPRGGGGGGGGAAAGAAAGGSGGGDDHYAAVAPLLLELAAAFVAAQSGTASMDTDEPATSAGEAGSAKAAVAGNAPASGDAAEAGGGGGGGGGVPAAEVAACLGAAFGTAGPSTAAQHGDAAAGALASLLAAATKAADQAAAAAAGLRIAEHAAELGAAAGALPVLSAAQPGCQAMLAQALRVAAEGKAAQLREAGLKLSQALLLQLWAGMGAEQRSAALAAVDELAARERLPALKSGAAALAGKLRAL